MVSKTTAPNSTRDTRKAVTVKFNNDEWDVIQRGINRIYSDELISKPTAYGYLKWCGLDTILSIENGERWID
jgi:hypothetical protein